MGSMKRSGDTFIADIRNAILVVLSVYCGMRAALYLSISWIATHDKTWLPSQPAFVGILIALHAATVLAGWAAFILSRRR